MVAADGWPARARGPPGVGPYTAAAVASFAWDAQVAAVDTNVRRVIERRDGVRRAPRALARRAAELLPEGRAAAWNQAMMELGATVCRPAAPALRRVPAAATGCAGPDAVAAAARPRGERFEATDRWARGRLLAALVAGEEPPPLAAERRERALAGLERDGLVVRDGGRRAEAAVRRVALTLRADAVEDVLDALMPLLPQGVYQRELDDGRAEVAFYGDTPDGAELDVLAGDALLARDEEEVAGGRDERRRRVGRALGGRRADARALACRSAGRAACRRSSSSRSAARSAPARTRRRA